MSSHAMGLAEDCKTSEFEVVPCKPLPAKVVPSALLSASIALGSADVSMGGFR